MKYTWSIICQKHTTNQEDGLMNIFGCINGINVKKKLLKNNNIIPTAVEIISSFVLETKDSFLSYKVEFVSPDKKILYTDSQTIKIKKGATTLRIFNKVRGIEFTKNGFYIFKIYQKNKNSYKKLGETPLFINTK